MRKPLCFEAAVCRLASCGRGRLPVAVCMAALALLVAGCAKSTRRTTNPCEDCVMLPRGICAGYYPTCWRLWPSECPTCPLASDQPATPMSAPPGMPGKSLPLAPVREEMMPVPPLPLDGAPSTGSLQLPPVGPPPTGIVEPPAERGQTTPDSSFAPRWRDVCPKNVVHRCAGRTRP
jgi:hypothetical protein